MNCIRRHLTYANVAATLALVIAIGGGSAMALGGKNSIRSSDIKNGQVTARDLTQIHSVTVSGTLSDPSADGSWTTLSLDATCRKGEKVIGGGTTNTSTSAPAATIESRPIGNGWHATLGTDSGQSTPVAATALCLSAKPG